MGGVASGDQEADTSVVPAIVRCDECRLVSGRVCSEMSNAKPVGYARRQLAILVHGSNRPSWVPGIGMLMLCTTSSAIMSSSIWRMTTRSSCSTRPAFSSRARHRVGWRGKYTGSAGKITNCQIGVFAAYVSRHGHAVIDRALYLPKEWTDDPDRLEAAYVPPDTGFVTNPKLATRMIARAVAASGPIG
jgi:DDE superfamily endonuclease